MLQWIAWKRRLWNIREGWLIKNERTKEFLFSEVFYFLITNITGFLGVNHQIDNLFYLHFSLPALMNYLFFHSLIL